MRHAVTLFAASAAVVGAAVLVGAANADVQFQTGNIQYTNVNFDADTHDFTIYGQVDNLGLYVGFSGFGIGPGYSPVELHAQHGVAFIETMHPDVDHLYRITMTAPAGYAFANIDWKLDAHPPSDGRVTFAALDGNGNAINVVGGSGDGIDDFFFDHNGQNPFHAHADAATPIYTLVITSTVPILDLKQVSVDLVQIPAPGAAGALAIGSLLAMRRRR